jgi:hypothetical protein
VQVVGKPEVIQLDEKSPLLRSAASGLLLDGAASGSSASNASHLTDGHLNRHRCPVRPPVECTARTVDSGFFFPGQLV